MGKIILKFKEILCGLDLAHWGLWSMADTCEHGSEPSSYINGRKILDHMSNY